ncbi:MAG: hypothetical protein OES14_07635 [Nitrosopumilus sp.]|nr:hypothetical protein [Nitrosopumilus sp.]
MTKTTINVEKTTRDKLAQLGTKNSTFEDIISKLLYEKEKSEID